MYREEARCESLRRNPEPTPRNMARRLSDLSDRELAPLFNMTVPEVRRYRRPSKSSFEDAMTDEMRAESERHEQWLWNLTVEEFKRLRESDDPDNIMLLFPKVPFDVAGRFRALQELLRNQMEFETRYPAAFEVLFPGAARRRERGGLYCPPSTSAFSTTGPIHMFKTAAGLVVPMHIRPSADGGERTGDCTKRTTT